MFFSKVYDYEIINETNDIIMKNTNEVKVDNDSTEELDKKWKIGNACRQCGNIFCTGHDFEPNENKKNINEKINENENVETKSVNMETNTETETDSINEIIQEIVVKRNNDENNKNIFIEISYKKNIVRYFANLSDMYLLYTHFCKVLATGIIGTQIKDLSFGNVYTTIVLYQYAHIYVPLYTLSLIYQWILQSFN